MIKKFILLCICSLLFLKVSAEQSGILFGEFYPTFGKMLPSTRSKGTLTNEYFAGATLGLGFQTTGNEYWKKFFKHPKYGARIGITNYSSEDFGQSISLYPFIQAPLFKSNKFSLEYNIGGGLGFHTQKYDPEKNPENDYISSYITAAINFALILEYEVSPQINTFVGGGFLHFSNGALRLPNLGINAPNVFCGLRYYQNPRESSMFNKSVEKPTYSKNEIYTFFAPSYLDWKINLEYKSYFASTLEFGYKRRFHPCMKWGAGIDIAYIGYEMDELSMEDPQYQNNISQSFIGSFDLLFDKVSINTAVGLYTYYSIKPRGIFYERVGVFYNFGNNFKQFAGISLKAIYGKADYIEWTYGFNIKTF